MRPLPLLGLLLLAPSITAPAHAQKKSEAELPAPLALTRNQLAEVLPWRSIGPANMSGRVTAFAVAEDVTSTYWVATASGGLLKTTNNGVRYEHQFDHEEVVSIGHVAVAPSDSQIVWVGTGEANPRNSVSYGNGVYRSTDGGASWKHMGLEQSFQIGRIVIHPTDPNIVYVGALGRLWGEGGERGLYKTTDGGKHWERVLYVDERTGVIDVDMHPEQPEVLVVATYERGRDLYDSNDPSKKWGPGGGLWRTEDGGQSWTRLSEGLPRVQIGRVGVDWHRKDPNILFAVIETERIGKLAEDSAFLGIDGEDADVGVRIKGIDKDSPADEAGLEKGDILLSVDGQHIKSWEEFVRRQRLYEPESKIALEYVRERELGSLEVELCLHPKERRGRTLFGAMLGGQDPNVQDEQGKDAVDMGGVYRSDDAGKSWTRVNSLNPRPMYFSQIRVDPSDPMYVYVLGISLYRSSDGGVTFTPDGHGEEVHVDHHALWIDPADGRHIMLGNDGGIYVSWDRMESWDHHNHVAIGQFYHVAVDHRPLYNVYGGLQDNGSWGGPSRTLGPGGARNGDWLSVGGGDGFVCAVDPEDWSEVYFESQNGAIGRLNLLDGQRHGVGADSEGLSLRFNWKTPFLISHHDPRLVYAASNYLLRSNRRGADMQAISPEITRTALGSATAIAESPLDAQVLFVGSDDGALWMTRSGGASWTPIFGAASETGGRTSLAGLFAVAVRGLDRDGDGALARAELPAALSGWFELGDADEDGSLAAAELSTLLERTARSARLRDLVRADDAWIGKWKGSLLGEAVAKKARKFELELARDDEHGLKGDFKSKELGKGELEELHFDVEAGTLAFQVQAEEGRLSLELRLGEEGLVGRLTAAAGFIGVDLEATRSKSTRGREEDELEPTPDGKPLSELLPGPMHVASLEASRFAVGRVYLAVDGHRSDDDAAHVFRSEDYGATWVSLAAELPRGSARVLREDATQANLLYLGTEFGAWCSLDRGQHWARMGQLPTVAVHEFAQPAGQPELVAATHGRSLWIADVSILRQLSSESADQSVHLFQPATAWSWRAGETYGDSGTRAFEAENPEQGSSLAYYLPERGKPRLSIESPAGETLREFEELEGGSGLHRLHWDLRGSRRNSKDELNLSRRLESGEYVLVLELEEQRWTRPLTVRELEQE